MKKISRICLMLIVSIVMTFAFVTSASAAGNTSTSYPNDPVIYATQVPTPTLTPAPEPEYHTTRVSSNPADPTPPPEVDDIDSKIAEASTSVTNPASTSDDPLRSPATVIGILRYGQEVRITDGTIYYESADYAGSGRQGIANNIYTETCHIAGFAVLDGETQRLVAYRCYLRDDVPYGENAPDFVYESDRANLWIGIYTDGFTTGSVGWCPIGDLIWSPGDMTIPEKIHDLDVPEPTETPYGPTEGAGTQPPREHIDIEDLGGIFHYKPEGETDNPTTTDVAHAIEGSTQNGEKIPIFLDASGSVTEYSAAIADYADQINTADFIAIFAAISTEIRAEEYRQYCEDPQLGGLTDIISALNTLPDEPFDTVVIVTDTFHNYGGYDLHQRDDIGRVLILNVYGPTIVYTPFIDAIVTNWNCEPIVQQLSLG